MTSTEHVDTHRIDIDCHAGYAFSRLEDVSSWAEMFDPTIHGCELSRSNRIQTIQLWATANGEAKTWVSDRCVNREESTISFAQSVSPAPVAAMNGQWRVITESAGRCTVELVHRYRATDDRPESFDWIARAVDTNSRKELAALKAACERSQDSDSAPFSFSDHVETRAHPSRVFEFLDRGDRWAERLDHVAEVSMHEYPGGLQLLRMQTRTPDGGTHLTESFRVSQGPAVLLYKQTTLPRLLSLHTGRWTIAPFGESWRVTSSHTVAVRPEAVEAVLGPGATVADARDLARNNLGENSRRTLEAAVRWAGDKIAVP